MQALPHIASAPHADRMIEKVTRAHMPDQAGAIVRLDRLRHHAAIEQIVNRRARPVPVADAQHLTLASVAVDTST
jgi:hypothetical protein